MPSPVSPNDFKNAIPSAAGQFCAKFLNVFQLPKLVFSLVDYMFDESGGLSTQFKTDLCALACSGSSGGTVNPNMPAPANLNASDGTYSDRVTITWSAVSAATKYKLYRSGTDNTDPNAATEIATINAPTLTYDDLVAPSNLVLGTTYTYWIKATDDANTSNFGGPDDGNAGAPTTTLPAISDLRCTKGFYHSSDGAIGLVWTPPSGTTKYDIYRNTVNDSGTATKIYSNVVPETTTNHFVPDNTPICWDNDGEIVLDDTPPSSVIHYFYWVIAKKDAPPAVSTYSNSDVGWVQTQDGTYNLGTFELLKAASPYIAVGTKLRVVLFGGGGGGAGGGVNYGGGGGGGGGVVIEEFVVVVGDSIALTAVPNTDDTGNAATQADGIVGSTMTLKINGVTKMVAAGGGQGLYNAAGAGAGGAGASGTGTTSPTIYNGKPGAAGAGSVGGKSGYRFGHHRLPSSHYHAGFTGDGFETSDPGSGSSSNPSAPSLATGGKGKVGSAVIAYGT